MRLCIQCHPAPCSPPVLPHPCRSAQKIYNKDGQLSIPGLLEGPRILKSHFPEADSVYRCRPGDTKQRLWYVA